jgi:asparagine synthase (glutamine-hydrolysing)
MCGIVALFAYSDSTSNIDSAELIRIRDHMTARGPDGSGAWISPDGRVGFGHRRLAIIDLTESGAQPMQSEDGRYVITFNGEIYNYKELRSDLEKRGYRFHSQSDTEVIMHMYDLKGPDMLHDLRGMYAFAIWDQRKQGVFLARDSFGIKPLYIADDGTTLRIASQVKALLAGGKIDTAPEPAGHVGFFLWGHVPEPYTLYKGIRALPAGSWLWVDRNCRKQDVFFSLSDEFRSAEQSSVSMTAADVQHAFREALLDSIRHHLVADVPVGLFLSSGLDSSTLTALASELKGNNLNTVTLGFREFIGTGNDEVPLAELVAQSYHTAHRTIWVGQKDFQAGFDSLLSAMDQPTIDGVNSFFVCKAAAQAGLKVALSGIGADEFFGGYSDFAEIPRLVSWCSPFKHVPGIGKGFRLVSAPIIKHLVSPKYAGIFEYGNNFAGAYLLRRGMYMPWELPEILDVEMVQNGWKELQTNAAINMSIDGIKNDQFKVSVMEMSWYMRNQLLRDADWASMAHSLEVRVPFVDVQLLRSLAPIMNSHKDNYKLVMAKSPAHPLPDSVISKQKTGFSIPVNEWIMNGNKPLAENGSRSWARHIYSKII